MKKLFTFLFLALSLSAFSVTITFEVSMKGSGMEYNNDSVFVVGGFSRIFNDQWTFVKLTSLGDSLFSGTVNLVTTDTCVYYFVTCNSWDTYADHRESVPEACANSAEITGDASWISDRAFIVPAAPLKVSYVFGSCEPASVVSDPGTNKIKQIVQQNFELYPNPAQNSVIIKLTNNSSEALVTLQDLTGKSVQNAFINGSTTLDIGDLPKGMYFVKVSIGDNSSVRKLMVY